jgi:hypothetical protein
MALTDQDILTEVQGLLAETENGGASYSSGMWTADEVLGYLDDRQQGVVTTTGLKLTRATLACAAGVLRHDLPADWIATQRLAWVRARDGRVFVLDRCDIWELDAALSGWRSALGTPQAYTDTDTPTLQVQVAPAPAEAGELRITYLALPTKPTGTGAPLTVPDEVAPGLVWGTIGRMLRKEGRAKDTARADAADQRYQLVVEAVKLLLRGWEG